MKKILVYLMFASHAAKRAALQDAQDVAALVLDAEMKLGEMRADITGGKPSGSPRGSQGGTSKPLPPDITKKESHQAQTLVRHRDIVDEVKEKARREDRIPTSHAFSYPSEGLFCWARIGCRGFVFLFKIGLLGGGKKPQN